MHECLHLIKSLKLLHNYFELYAQNNNCVATDITLAAVSINELENNLGCKNLSHFATYSSFKNIILCSPNYKIIQTCQNIIFSATNVPSVETGATKNSLQFTQKTFYYG